MVEKEKERKKGRLEGLKNEECSARPDLVGQRIYWRDWLNNHGGAVELPPCSYGACPKRAAGPSCAFCDEHKRSKQKKWLEGRQCYIEVEVKIQGSML